MASTPINPIGNAIFTATGSVFAPAIPDGMAQICFYIANLHSANNAFVSFVTASATEGEAVNHYPILAFDSENFITTRDRPAFYVTGGTCAVTLVYYQL